MSQARARKSNAPRTATESLAAAPPRPDPLFVCSLAEDAARAPRWIIENLLEEGEQLLLYGNPKTGKSQLALQLALSVALEVDFLDRRSAPGRKVLYINLEMGARPFAVRVVKMARQLLAGAGADSAARGLTEQEVEGRLSSRFRYISSERNFNVIETGERERWRRAMLTERPDFVVLDTLAKAHGLDENVSQDMTWVMKKVRELFGVLPHGPLPSEEVGELTPPAAQNIAHVLVHHAGKGEGKLGGARIRGSSAIHGEADLIFFLGNADHAAKNDGLSGKQKLEVEARNIASEDCVLRRNGEIFEIVRAEAAPAAPARANPAAHPSGGARQVATTKVAATKTPRKKAPVAKPKVAVKGTYGPEIIEVLAGFPGTRLLVSDLVDKIMARGKGRKAASVRTCVRRMVGENELWQTGALEVGDLPPLLPSDRKLTLKLQALGLPKSALPPDPEKEVLIHPTRVEQLH